MEENSAAQTLDRGGANDDEITYPALVKALRRRRGGAGRRARAQRIGRRPCRGQRRCTRSRPSTPRKLPRDMPIVLICRSGNRSMTALTRARAAGFTDIWHYKGGALGWAREGGELVV